LRPYRSRSSTAWVQRRRPRCAPSALRRARTCDGKPSISYRTASASQGVGTTTSREVGMNGRSAPPAGSASLLRDRRCAAARLPMRRREVRLGAVRGDRRPLRWRRIAFRFPLVGATELSGWRGGSTSRALFASPAFGCMHAMILPRPVRKAPTNVAHRTGNRS
jgi:hypothetical protein